MSLLPSSTGNGESNSIVTALKQSLTLLDQLIAERSNLRQQLTNLSKNVRFDLLSKKMLIDLTFQNKKKKRMIFLPI